ncbi:MAG TPA: glycoside hydrolase family 88 protein [Arachnia sp.]|nr:glycoside hydrolase family 88 protein [Arachnia sp.]HMT87616.1 glycoside hydrolase family 88 protein [Arachnia sp.]
MAGEDLSSSELAERPRSPLSVDAFLHRQDALEGALNEATAHMGLTRWFWGEGVCLLAADRLAQATRTPAPEWVSGFYAAHLRTAPVLEHVNNLAPGAALADAYGRAPTPEALNLLELCYAWFRESEHATRAPNGALEHWPGGVWADTVYMAGEFLLRAGLILERPEMVAEAVEQWLAHAELLQDPVSGLFAHGTQAGERIPCHWGRANAWIALAGVDLWRATGSEEVRERVLIQLDALAVYQPEHGVWDVLVDSPVEVRGILETSAAAGLGAAMLRAGRLLLDEDPTSEQGGTLFEAGDLAVRGSLAYVDDGWLTRVSAGTILQLIPFGYSVIRDDRPQPWGQGLAIEALAAYRETHR